MHLYRRFCGQRRWNDDHHHLQRAADRNAHTDADSHADADTDADSHSDSEHDADAHRHMADGDGNAA